jgi:hypothetical protein
MPIQKLQFRPGVNREGTTLANEGGWFQGNNIRFRSGQVEKIGGWTKDSGQVSTGGSYVGVCRSLLLWNGLTGYSYCGIGTNQKFYIQNGTNGNLYDVTPIRTVISSPSASFAATNGSTTITVTQAGHGAQTGDTVIFSGTTSLGGNITAAILNQSQGYQITYISSSQYSITTSVAANASDTGNGGGAVTATYQITSGNAIYTTALGWGAGGWGGATTGLPSTGWGLPASTGVGSQMRLWSQANYGQNLVFNYRGGPIYYWVVDTNPNVFDVAQVLSKTNTNTQNSTQYWLTDSYAPTICNFVMVSDASRFTIGFGTDTYGDGKQNPMLVSWSDQENILVWQPSVTNQAGNFVLSKGSQIVSAKQNRQEIVVWTDSALYSMQYLGAPYVFGFTLMMDNISIIGPNVTAVANNVVYWMGQDKFYMYSGTVSTLPCTLREYVFQNINRSQSAQFFAGTNEGFNEVWWFYCSQNSTVIDSYVIYNYLEQIWYYGSMTRTAWYDSPLRTYPLAAGYQNNAVSPQYGGVNPGLIYHEDGVDDGTTNPPSPIYAYIQSSDFDIGDGSNFGFVWRLIPDISFNGSYAANPAVNFTMLPRQNPGAAYGSDDTPQVVWTGAPFSSTQSTYNVQQFTQYAYCRMRGRQMALVVSSDQLGVQWQLGNPRLDVRPDGRR